MEKCQFHAQSVPFLGFILLPEGIRIDLAMVKAVADWPTPDKVERPSVFWGLPIFRGSSLGTLVRSPFL